MTSTSVTTGDEDVAQKTQLEVTARNGDCGGERREGGVLRCVRARARSLLFVLRRARSQNRVTERARHQRRSA